MVFRQGYRTTDVTLFAVVFEWDGYDFLVHKSYSKAATPSKPGEDTIKTQGENLAGELLADPR